MKKIITTTATLLLFTVVIMAQGLTSTGLTTQKKIELRFKTATQRAVDSLYYNKGYSIVGQKISYFIDDRNIAWRLIETEFLTEQKSKGPKQVFGSNTVSSQSSTTVTLHDKTPLELLSYELKNLPLKEYFQNKQEIKIPFIFESSFMGGIIVKTKSFRYGYQPRVLDEDIYHHPSIKWIDFLGSWFMRLLGGIIVLLGLSCIVLSIMKKSRKLFLVLFFMLGGSAGLVFLNMKAEHPFMLEMMQDIHFWWNKQNIILVGISIIAFIVYSVYKYYVNKNNSNMYNGAKMPIYKPK